LARVSQQKNNPPTCENDPDDVEQQTSTCSQIAPQAENKNQSGLAKKKKTVNLPVWMIQSGYT